MKVKLLTFLILLSSLLVYLEWSKTERIFLFEIEASILWKLFTDFSSVLHPFIILPFVGQMLLMFSLFQKKTNKRLIYLGIACLAVLIVFIFGIGLLSMNLKITLSSLPFIVFSSLQIHNLRNLKN
jgi:hypothetical protein